MNLLKRVAESELRHDLQSGWGSAALAQRVAQIDQEGRARHEAIATSLLSLR